MPTHTLKTRTYLDADGKATIDETLGRSLLGIEGDDITMEQAYAAGLVKTEPQPEEVPDAQMLYYDAAGNRVSQPASGGFQYLDNDPTRPDASRPGEAANSESQAPAEPDDLDSMKKADLLALAEERGVELPDGAKVAEIRAALRAADKE